MTDSPTPPEVLDTVATPEGDAVVVGFLDPTQVEVRYPSRQLRIWGIKQVRVKDAEHGLDAPDEILAPAPPLSFEEARAAGQTPSVPLETFGDLNGPRPVTNPDAKPTSTLAEMVGKGGKPLSGAAKAKAAAKRARERGEG